MKCHNLFKFMVLVTLMSMVFLSGCQLSIPETVNAAAPKPATEAKVTEDALTEAQFEKALLPLPPSLKDGASIIAFDEDWNRIVLREGTSDLACVAEAPFMGIQYAVCQHISAEPFWVFGMQQRAQGIPGPEVNANRVAALIDGSLEAPVAGTARYFLIGGSPAVLFPLMIINLPNATSETTGLSSEPSAYRPWLMEAGTPGAHVMIMGK